jgi:hypothetical protein
MPKGNGEGSSTQLWPPSRHQRSNHDHQIMTSSSDQLPRPPATGVHHNLPRSRRTAPTPPLAPTRPTTTTTTTIIRLWKRCHTLPREVLTLPLVPRQPPRKPLPTCVALHTTFKVVNRTGPGHAAPHHGGRERLAERPHNPAKKPPCAATC